MLTHTIIALVLQLICAWFTADWWFGALQQQWNKPLAASYLSGMQDSEITHVIG